MRGFTVVDGKKLKDSRVIAVINDKVPDGLRVDTEGLLWISAGDGIHCYTKEGERLGSILVPETVANLTFGGFGKSRMFICATSSVYAIETARTGAQWPYKKQGPAGRGPRGGIGGGGTPGKGGTKRQLTFSGPTPPARWRTTVPILDRVSSARLP